MRGVRTGERRGFPHVDAIRLYQTINEKDIAVDALYWIRIADCTDRMKGPVPSYTFMNGSPR